MATLTPTIPVHTPQRGRGGHEPPSSVRGGGGNNGGGSGAPNYNARLRRARLGLIVGLTSVVMIFVALTSAQVIRRGLPMNDGTGKAVSDWLPVNLPIPLLLVNTFLLILSSVTVELARRRTARQVTLSAVGVPGVSVGVERSFPWLGATVLLGLGFLSGQWMAWRELADRGFYVSTSPSSSFVYLLTAAHAVHLFGGVVALLYAVSAWLSRRPVESRSIVVDIAAWYWHFMALLWVYIFALLYFAR